MSRVMDGVILFAILAIFAGFAAHRLPFTASGTVPVRFPIALPIFLLLLVVLSVIDLHTFRLPDWGTKSGMFLGLLVSVLGCWVARVSLISPLQSVVGLLSGYGLLWAIAFGYRLITGREGLGMGDAKLLGMIGSWMGVAAVGNTLFLGSFLGSALVLLLGKGKNIAVPFGPFLATGAILSLAFPQISIFP
jgi:leader peptidase (prepilin peptidase)/N-methyltransferase